MGAERQRLAVCRAWQLQRRTQCRVPRRFSRCVLARRTCCERPMLLHRASAGCRGQWPVQSLLQRMSLHKHAVDEADAPWKA